MKRFTARDRDLVELFQQQRRNERSQTPDLAAVLRGSPPANEATARGWWPSATVVGALVLTLVLTIVVIAPRLIDPRLIDPAAPVAGSLPTFAATWAAPTDFLLDMTGRELLSQVPSLGAVSQLLAASASPSTSTPERSPP